MRIGRYRFAPPWWGVAATLVCVAVFVVAGIWQIQRGQAKAAMLTQRRAASQAPAKPLLGVLVDGQVPAAMAVFGPHVKVRGHYDPAHQILLDNQTHEGRAGYRVWTPLVLADGRRMLIDRGWVPIGPGGRDDLPAIQAPDGEIKVTGILRGLPKPGIRLGDGKHCDLESWPRVLNYPSIGTVRCQYLPPVINGLILLDEDEAHGFVRNWQADVRMPPERHYGYAFQWFAMAVAVAVVCVVVNMKRMR